MHSGEFGGEWHSIVELLGTMWYLLGSIALYFMSLSVHKDHLRNQRRQAVELINALASAQRRKMTESELEERVVSRMRTKVDAEVSASVLRMKTAMNL